MSVNKRMAETLNELADALENGRAAFEPVIAFCDSGCELGTAEALEGARRAKRSGRRVLYIGPGSDSEVECITEPDPEKAHARMQEALASGRAQAAVTMHYPFPLGVTTIGRVSAPASGRAMYVASTTGSISSNRVEALLENCVCGVAAARACGVAQPTVGIANIDGARKTETILRALQRGGWDIRFAESGRADGGVCLRGNDILSGCADVLLCDSLTGNLLTTILSAYSSGGGRETTGWGYGPGMGRSASDLVLIVSRASGAPVIAGAIEYAAELLRGGWKTYMQKEFAAADAAGLRQEEERLRAPKTESAAAPVSAPPKEILDCGILGVDVSSMEQAVEALWKLGIYAESAMGCTGPVIMVNHDREQAARSALSAAGLIE